MQTSPRFPGIGATITCVPEAVALGALVVLPSYINLASEHIFEPEKALLLRAAALLAIPGALRVAYQQRAWLRRQPVVWTLLALVAVVGLSAALSIAPETAVMGGYFRRHGWVKWLALASLFLVLCDIARTPRGRETLLQAIAIGSIWPCLYLLVQHGGLDLVTWQAPTEGFLPGTTFGNHILVGGYLASVMPLTLLLAWRGWSAGAPRMSLIWFAVTALQGTALVMARSRGAWVALAAGLVAFAAIAVGARMARSARIAVAATAFGAMVLLVTVSELRPSVLSRMFDPSVGSARVRVLIWQGTVDVMRASGWRLWLGYGPETLQAVFPPFYSAEVSRLEGTDAMPDRAHNEVLDALASSGVIGVTVELTWFGAILMAVWRVRERPMRAALTAAVVAHLVELQFGIASVTSRMMLLAVAALALGLAADEPPPLVAETGRKRVVRAAMTSRGFVGRSWPWLCALAVVAAMAPVITALPPRLLATATSGTADDFVRYLTRMSLASPLLYVALLVPVVLYAGSLARRPGVKAASVPERVGVTIALVLAVPVAVTPSRADVISHVASDFAGESRWTEASLAYAEAVRLQPARAEYLGALGRVRLQEAGALSGAARLAKLSVAKGALEQARANDPSELSYLRQLASVHRVEAATVDAERRTRALDAADALYQEATRRAPGLTMLWIEWAHVDLDRRDLDAALKKLTWALTLDESRVDAWVLRGQLHAEQQNHGAAMADFDAALARAPQRADAQAGRAAAQAALSR